MQKLKIAVYTMAKNEEQHVEQFCKTTAGADTVVITDTGSTDDTVAKLQAHGVVVHHASIMPWRFDLATNIALAHVPADIDVCVKLDLDEVLWTKSGRHWRDVIEERWSRKASQLQYTYVWNWQVRGEVPGVQFTACHIHGRSGYYWRHPGHAALTYTQGNAISVQSDDLQIHHYAVGKSRPDYLALLELAVHENECPRTLYYLGREYAARKMDDKAITLLLRYLEHKKATWKAERAEAMRLLGTCFVRTQQHPTALKWFINATAEYPKARDPWYSLLVYLLDVHDYTGALWAGTRCLAITSRDNGYVSQSAVAWSAALYITMATVYQQLGMQDKMLDTLTAGLALFPQDTALEKFALDTNKFERVQ